jgi:hypothetical protein
MMSRQFPKQVVLCAALAFAGCAPRIGDSCETSAECPGGAICDVTAPGGYCTLDGCDAESCPDGTVCIEFDSQNSFCLEYCEDTSECRKGYVCRTDIGSAGFCYVQRDES